MPVGEYLAGLLFLGVTWGCAGFSAWVVVRRRLRHLTGINGLLAWAILFIAGLIAVHLLPGALGVLSRWSVLATAVLLALGVSRLSPGGDVQPSPFPPPRATDDLWLRVMAAIAILAVAAYCVVDYAGVATDAPRHVDALTFGLPTVAEWIRSGSMFEIGVFVPLVPVRNYPNNGDVLFLALTLPWRGDAFVRVLSLPLLALAGLAIYAIGRELRAPTGIAALVAAAFISSRVVLIPGIESLKPDLFMYATFSVGVLFLLRYVRTWDRAELMLGSLGLGLAFGSRWYGVSTAIVVVGVLAAGSLIARRMPRRVVSDMAIAIGVVFAAGGFWLLRNLAVTGNPLYPLDISVLGVTIFDAPRDVVTEGIGFTILDRLQQPDTWSDYLLHDYRRELGLMAALFLIGVAFTLGVGLRQLLRRRRVPGRAVGLAVVAAGIASAYAITPGSGMGFPEAPLPGLVGAQSRWAVPALIAGAGVSAWALARQQASVRLVGGLLLLVAVGDGIAQSFSISRYKVAATAVAIVAVVALGVLVLRRLSALEAERRRVLLGFAAAALVGVSVIAGYALQRRYEDRRFADNSIIKWVSGNLAPGSKVGMAGNWELGYVPIFGVFGPDYRNRVRYVGPVVRDQVRQYAQGDDFRRELRRGGYDAVVVGRAREPDFENLEDLPVPEAPKPGEEPLELGWALAAGYSVVARDDDFVLVARPTG